MTEPSASDRLERWSPVDAVRLLAGAAALILLVLADRLFGDSLVSFISDVLAGFQVIDADVITALAVVARAGTLLFLAAGVVSAAIRGRWSFVATAAVGGLLAAAMLLVVDGLLDAEAPSVLASADTFGALGGRGFSTAAGLAALTGVVAAAVPWFARRERRLAWGLVAILVFVRAFTAPVSFETAAALACGVLAGALADAVLGTPSRRPTQAAVVDGLTRCGVHLDELRPASVDARGSIPFFGSTTDGTALFVKVLGVDERKADLLFRLIRSVQPRDLGDERPFSSLRRAVEHEALVALAAAEVGVRTPPLAGFASAEPGGFVLAYEAIEGRSLDGVDPDEITDEVLAGIWEQMAILRAHGIAHRDLRLANIFLAADGAVWMIDFGFSELAAPDLLIATDLAELVTSLSLKVGPGRAVASAELSVGADLQGALARFASGFLSGATRTALKERPELLGEVRARIETPKGRP